MNIKENDFKRSPQWPKVQAEHLKLQPFCIACGQPVDNQGLQAHHIIPFHYCIALGRPDLELDHRNLITLCEKESGKTGEDHHLLIGHLNNFKSSNLNVVNDSKFKYNKLNESEIKENSDWLNEKQNQLKELDKMSEQEKTDLRKLMDTWYPLK